MDPKDESRDQVVTPTPRTEAELDLDAPVELEDAPPAPPGTGRQRGVVVAAILVVLVLGLGWVAMRVMGSGDLGQDPFGRAAPNFELPRLKGEGTVSLSDFKGKPVVLNFWASWCGPCKDEGPVLAAAERKWRDQDVVFLGVDSEDTRQAALEFEQAFGIEYDSAFDEQGELEAKYGVLGFPETFFIDRQGKIHGKYVGPIDAQTLDTYVSAIV